jgi:hypothetical protein
METVPSKEGLLKLLQRKKLQSLVDEYKEDPEVIEDWKKRTEGQWEKELLAIKGNSSGFSDIYNYLHPRSEGILYFKVGTAMDIDPTFQRPPLMRTNCDEHFIQTNILLKEFVAQMKIESIKSISENDLFKSRNSNPEVTLSIPIVNQKPNILYTEEFYEYLKLVDMTPAAKRFTTKGLDNATMLIGTSGSGKTATCFQVGRSQFCLYFDCYNDTDFGYFIDMVKKYPPNTQDIEIYCKNLYLKLIHARYYLLNRLFDEKTMQDNRTPWKWFSYQRSNSFQNAVKLILDHVEITTSLIFPSDGIVEVKVVEANYLLDVLKDKISSTSKQVPNSRPLLSLIVRCNQLLGIPHIYAETHLSMKDQSLILSGAGGGKDIVNVFSDFDFYTPTLIKHLLQQTLAESAFNSLMSHPKLLNRCCTMLQGRVRFFSVFIMRLAYTFDGEFLKNFKNTLDTYVKEMTSENSNESDVTSLYSFWKRNWRQAAYNMDIKSPQNVSVFDCLLELLINYYMHDQQNRISFPVDLVDSALTKLNQEGYSGYSYSMDEPLARLRFLSSFKKKLFG